jgi:large subunit ribosomal protein L24e
LKYIGNPRKLKWTKAFRKAAGKEMVVDTTLTFAARRHVPTRYSRDLVAKTLTAMQRVEEIRRKRERVFYKNRMVGNKERERVANKKLVDENQHLLPPNMRTVVKAGVLEEREAVSLEAMEMDVVEEEEKEEEKELIKVPVKAGRNKQRGVEMEMD